MNVQAMNVQDRIAQAESQIRAILDERIAALRTKDAERFMAQFAPDFVTFEIAPPLQFKAGDDPEGKNLKQWLASFKGPVGAEVRNLKITTDGELAFCHSLYHLTGSRTSGEETDVWMRQTLCFRKAGGRWAILHSHISVPFYMDGSDRAAVDLKP